MSSSSVGSRVIQAQWNIDQSANSVIGIARGILQAATTDNIQVLAIVACERFGATLAISQETRMKVEKDVIFTPEPAVLDFLKATIGFRIGDCITQLSGSLAGVQFIGLASALITSMPAFKAALAIQTMLVDTAKDKTFVPTIRQIQDLLTSIEPRCTKVSFSTEVAGWQAVLANSGHEYLSSVGYSRFPCFPQPDGVTALVDAFRQLFRLGKASISGIIIQTSVDAVAWTIAFVKWCVGVPPSATFDDGTPLITSDNSTISVIIGTNKHHESVKDYVITLQSTIDSPLDLIKSTVDGYAHGMVDIPAYGKLLLQYFDMQSELAMRALHQSLPCALQQVKELLVFNRWLENYSPDQNNSVEGRHDILFRLRLSPFTSDEAIARAYCRLFGLEEDIKLRPLGQAVSVENLPLIQLYLKCLETKCDCEKCLGFGETWNGCQKEDFWENFYVLVAIILSLSLFEDLEELKLRNGLTEFGRSLELCRAIKGIIENGKLAVLQVDELLSTARHLIGHDRHLQDQGHNYHALLTSFGGQAVWPSIHGSYTVRKNGYLSLAWYRGTIFYDDERYSIVYGTKQERSYVYGEPIETPLPNEVSKVCSLIPVGSSIRWVVSPLGQEALGAHMTISDGSDPKTMVVADLFYVSLSASVLLERCPHPADAELEVPAKFAYFTKPLFRGQYPREEDRPNDVLPTTIVAVDGNDDMRFIALNYLATGHTGAVLRKKACLSCCLNVSAFVLIKSMKENIMVSKQ